MRRQINRRAFAKSLLLGTASLGLAPAALRAAGHNPFAFVLLGDLHFDKLKHHDLEWLQREKPDDLRQVREYSALTETALPRLFTRVRETITSLHGSADTRAAFMLQAGDLVEGLCGSELLATQQNNDALEFLADAQLGIPFLFTKGNHDITGKGAPEAFASVFHPFLGRQLASLKKPEKVTSARLAFEWGDALFCLFDAYDKDSLPWLEAALAQRTLRHCFIVAHPPVVPYGARSTWHLFSREREKPQRDHLLDLLGKHNVFVLGGHIHKYSMLVRSTPHSGRFGQVAISSVIGSLEGPPQHLLEGVGSYTPDQVAVEPAFSPDTEAQRRKVYEAERPAVRQFQYADLPGYAVVKINGPKVSLDVYSRVSSRVWRSLDLTQLLTG